MLNHASLALAADLDSKVEPFSAKGLATLGAAVRKAKARKPAPKKAKTQAKKSSSVLDFFGGLFDKAKSSEEKLAGAFSPVAGKLLSAAGALGFNLPLDKDIAAAESMKDDLGDMLAEASEAKDSLLKNIGKKGGPTASVGKNLAAAIVQGKLVMNLLDQSQAALQAARSALLAGKNPAVEAAKGETMLKLAKARYTKATQALRSVVNASETHAPKPLKAERPAAPDGYGKQIATYGGMGGGGVPLDIPSEDDDLGLKPSKSKAASKSSAFHLPDLGQYGPLMLAAAAATAAYFAAKPRRA
jgi:hypothetical protein